MFTVVSSVAQSCLILWDPMDCSTPGFCVHHQLPVYSCPSRWWCHPTISSSVAPFSSCPQSFPALGALHIRWPKYFSFSFSISPSNEYPGLISFRIDWFDLLTVQESLKSLLQHHNWKESILQQSAFFLVQLSYPYMTTGKREYSALIPGWPGGSVV